MIWMRPREGDELIESRLLRRPFPLSKMASWRVSMGPQGPTVGRTLPSLHAHDLRNYQPPPFPHEKILLSEAVRKRLEE